MINKNRVLILIILVFLLTTFIAPPDCHSRSGKRITPPDTTNGSYEQEFSYEISGEELIFGKMGDFDTVSISDGISGCSYLAKPGYPNIPIIGINIAVPYDVEVTGLRVLDITRSALPESFFLMPGPEMVLRMGASPAKKMYRIDEDIYASSDPYPADVLSIATQIAGRGQGYVVIGFNPVQYMPAKRSIT